MQNLVLAVNRMQKPEVNSCLRCHEVNVDRISTKVLRSWNVSVIDMIKRAKDEKLNDIRNYFQKR